MSLMKNKQDWEELGELDPVGAIRGVSIVKGRFSDWDAFFRCGEQEIGEVLKIAGELGWQRKAGEALDFGCGLGKLTRALGKRFRMVYGLDISEAMIVKAQALSNDSVNCKFVVNPRPDLRLFPDGHFEFIYTRIVLQHVPDRSLIKAYICEFLRVLEPGGLLVFQLPGYIPLVHRLQPRRRLYAGLKNLGIPRDFLYRQLRLAPGVMNFVPEEQVMDLLVRQGASVLRVIRERITGNVMSLTYYVTNRQRPD
jgi:ubiquinone/menaquinone biosynthesis C-methylase UbiE